jgi:hypothetical protein
MKSLSKVQKKFSIVISSAPLIPHATRSALYKLRQTEGSAKKFSFKLSLKRFADKNYMERRGQISRPQGRRTRNTVHPSRGGTIVFEVGYKIISRAKIFFFVPHS